MVSTKPPYSSISRLILGPTLSRRSLVAGGSTLGMMGLVPAALLDACKSVGASSQLREDAVTGGAPDWLAALDPIQTAQFPLSDFLGDKPINPHALIRDSDNTPRDVTPSEQVPLVIIGGGMSGLACAYLLQDKAPIILEQAAQFGGNSKGESWNGIEYSIGAAYLMQLDENDPIRTTFYQPLGIDKLWRSGKGFDKTEFKGQIFDDFWDGGTVGDDPVAKAQIQQLKTYFLGVLNGNFPDIPPKVAGPLLQNVLDFDKRSFLEEVSAQVTGPLHPHIHRLLEQYCWSSMGASASEISAAGGLNFYAAEFGGAYVLPGGNSKVASVMLRQLATKLPQSNFRAGALVTNVVIDTDDVKVHYLLPNGDYKVIAAKTVVMACAKFIAARILKGTGDAFDAQISAMSNLNYRGYLVANVLLDQPLDAKAYDLYLLGQGAELGADIKANALAQKVTDVVFGHFAQAPNPTNAVLTLYRAFPYEARSQLLAKSAFATYTQDFMNQIPGILGAVGYTGTVTADMVRISRWGHPIVVSQTGLYANGTVQQASATMGNKVFFCNQDNWALPAIETCLQSALQTNTDLRAVLG